MAESNRDKVLKCRSLPTPPVVAVKLLELTRDPDVKLQDIAKLVESDPALAAKVLKLVNSSIYGLVKPCRSIERAMGFLGLNTVKSVVLGFSLVESVEGVEAGEGFDFEAFWRRLIYAASATRLLAQHTASCDPDEAFTAAIFQDMGMLAAHIALKGDYDRVLITAPDRHSDLCDWEREQLGFEHAEMGAELARMWNLPELLAEVIRHHHTPDGAQELIRPLARTVALGRIAAEGMNDPIDPEAMAGMFVYLKEWFGKDSDELQGLVDKIATAAGELAKMFEKDIGQRPDISGLMNAARDCQLELQIAMNREADQLREQTQALKTEAYTDGLTKAANRKQFDIDFERLHAETAAGGEPLGVIFSDADRFKSVNDTHGHQAGDAVLIELAARMRKTVGDAGTVFRYGGEEFAILLPKHGEDAAAEVAERIRVAMESSPFDLSAVEGAPDTLPVTVSLGVSAADSVRAGEVARDTLLQEADEAVYASKRNGRNRVSIFSRDCGKDAEEPAVAAETPAPQPVAPALAVPTSGTVLLVEDDALAATLVRVMLSKHGDFKVEWVRTAEMGKHRALSAQSGASFVLCMIDQQLPDGAGVDVIRELRARAETASVPIIAFSSSFTDVLRAQAIEAGADRVYNKHEIATNLSGWLREILALPAHAA